VQRLRQEQRGEGGGGGGREEKRRTRKIDRRSFAGLGPNRLVFDDFTPPGPKIFPRLRRAQGASGGHPTPSGRTYGQPLSEGVRAPTDPQHAPSGSAVPGKVSSCVVR
jgi:hypothetical protein